MLRNRRPLTLAVLAATVAVFGILVILANKVVRDRKCVKLKVGFPTRPGSYPNGQRVCHVR